MSSMVRKTFASLLLSLTLAPATALAQSQDGADWDQARAQHATNPSGVMAQAISRWQMLNQTDQFAFDDYAGFLLGYPGFPEENKLRLSAEHALDRSPAQPARIVAFFDRYPPLTNSARAQYALALNALGRPQARQVALEAWRGGQMGDAAEPAIFAMLAPTLKPDDHDVRMDALLWAGANAQAERQALYVSPASRDRLLARLGMINGKDPETMGVSAGPDALRDAGYVYNRARMLRTTGQGQAAGWLMASRPVLPKPPRDTRKWIGELLADARSADSQTAVRIAAGVDDAFPPGTDVSTLSYQIRDDYTSLMWLGGMKALKDLGDGARAAALFWRYGAAARTAQTRSKGFYWAGRAMLRAGNSTEASRYFQLAAAYPDQFYGLLSLERLGRPIPPLDSVPQVVPTRDERQAFYARPLTQAVREVARDADWPTAVRFFREISEQAQSESDHVLVTELAREIGRRDLGVILGQAAHTDGHGIYRRTSFPLIPVPQGANWTTVHAISRQESQFAQDAVSHAGARGLMQLMPGTAREQSNKLGMVFDYGALTGDAGYNMTLGDAYFQRLLDYFGGSFPLAVGAYNAGAGNVNKWLRANGDPRNGSVEWVDWIEKIPLSETRGYIAHVLENAVVYEAMYPAKARYRGSNPMSHLMGKSTPG